MLALAVTHLLALARVVNWPGDSGTTPLIAAVASCDPALATLVLGQKDVNVNQVDEDGGMTALQHSVSYEDDGASDNVQLHGIVKLLLARNDVEPAADDNAAIRGASENGQVLAGHFLRGHAESPAYDLACNGASWTTEEGVNRARHTL